MSLLLLYRPTLDETIFDADGDLGHRKKKRAKKKVAAIKLQAKAEKEQIRVKSFFVAVQDEQGKKRLIEQEIDDLLLFAMYLDD